MQDNGLSKMEIKNSKVRKLRARIEIPYFSKYRLQSNRIKRAYRIRRAKLNKYYKKDLRTESNNNLCINRSSTSKCLITSRPHQ